MKIEQWIRAIAGVLVLTSIGLVYFHHRYWFFFTAFVGINLLHYALTELCLVENIPGKQVVAEKS